MATAAQFRLDGYVNMLNKWGTQKDNSTAYEYTSMMPPDDITLLNQYETNGLFANIINRPAEESVKHGLDIDFGDEKTKEFVDTKMDDLDQESKFAEAMKWARLYGGALIVMFVADGRSLEKPLNMRKAKAIQELRVFDRTVCMPDYSSMYGEFDPRKFSDGVGFGEPEFFDISSIHGNFRVHRSRCLVFHNDRMPESATSENYRYWGIPEYARISRALRECVTTHHNGPLLLERSVQAIYSMKNLGQLLATADGEDMVIKRLSAIDMARNILNSIAIDGDGESYTFANASMSGVKDIIDTTCQMLSAVTNIPQTILFGRSPSGENSTGESDFENYYNMVEGIQKRNMKKNYKVLIDLILQEGKAIKEISKIPRYVVKFKPLWSESETEVVGRESTKAGIKKTMMEVLLGYKEAGIIGDDEIRKMVSEDEDFDISPTIPKEVKEKAEQAAQMGENGGQMPPKEGGQENVPPQKKEPTEPNKKPTEQENPNEEEPVVKKDSRFDSAYDEWLEQNLELFENENGDVDEKAERNFAQWKSPRGNRPRTETDVDVIDMLWKEYKKRNDSVFFEGELNHAMNDDGEDIKRGVGVMIIKDGKCLVGTRGDNHLICGPGGHMQDDETPEQAAVRETQEEFGITPKNLVKIGDYKPSKEARKQGECPSVQFIATEWDGEVKVDNDEMFFPRWENIEDLLNVRDDMLFEPFDVGLDIYERWKNGISDKQ